MNKIFTLLFFAITLVACGKKQSPFSTAGYGVVASEAEPYYERFLEYADCFGSSPYYVDIKIDMAWGLESETAYCVRRSNGYNQIVVDAIVWSTMSQISKERVFFHEMGHCYLNLEHISQDQEPYMMTEVIHGGLNSEYVLNYDQNIKQLFNRPTTCSFEFQSY